MGRYLPLQSRDLSHCVIPAADDIAFCAYGGLIEASNTSATSEMLCFVYHMKYFHLDCLRRVVLDGSFS